MEEHDLEFLFMVLGAKLTEMQESCYKLSDCLINCSEDGFSYELVISQELKNINQFSSTSATKSKSHNAADDTNEIELHLDCFPFPSAKANSTPTKENQNGVFINFQNTKKNKYDFHPDFWRKNAKLTLIKFTRVLLMTQDCMIGVVKQ